MSYQYNRSHVLHFIALPPTGHYSKHTRTNPSETLANPSKVLTVQDAIFSGSTAPIFTGYPAKTFSGFPQTFPRVLLKNKSLLVCLPVYISLPPLFLRKKKKKRGGGGSFWLIWGSQRENFFIFVISRGHILWLLQ